MEKPPTLTVPPTEVTLQSNHSKLAEKAEPAQYLQWATCWKFWQEGSPVSTIICDADRRSRILK